MKVGSTANKEDLLLHAGWLRRFAVALVKDLDAAEDIVQETLVVAWQRPADNTGRPWLARVARNWAIDFWRSSDRRERRELAAAATDIGTVASPEELIGDTQIHRAVAEAVAALEEPFRQTLVLRFFHGVSSADIARGLHKPDEAEVTSALRHPSIVQVVDFNIQRSGHVFTALVGYAFGVAPGGVGCVEGIAAVAV
jgi:RNA polymerase sigma-70 factor (ECF subfamily)